MENPTFKQALIFLAKSKLLQTRRALLDTTGKIDVGRLEEVKVDEPILAEHKSQLWMEDNPLERDLTAGKVQNLRIACKALNGLVIQGGNIFSFWKNVGRTSRSKGYVVGRELREGCIIPNLGGGLCQLSNALYDAALKAGFEIIERHAHSRVIEGSLAEINRDATVFWNYVDLRFRSTEKFQVEAKLSKDQLIVRILGKKVGSSTEVIEPVTREVEHLGNCYSCNVASCFRNDQQTTESVKFGTTAALVDGYTPEFDRYLSSRITDDDYFFVPIDGKRFKAGAYKWDLTDKKQVRSSSSVALQRAYTLRKIPKQGRALQQTLLQFDKKLAENYAKKLDYSVSHVIVSINLLPHLWRSGALGGRTFDVLANRLPLYELQSRLDTASALHPESSTLADFRVDEGLLDLEKEALMNANKVITAHHDVGAVFGERAEMLDWVSPENKSVETSKFSGSSKLKLFFPASALGRKGVYELAESLQDIELPVELIVLGKASEGEACPLQKLPSIHSWRYGSVEEMQDCQLVVLPAFIEHSSRLLLRALSLGIPVIASKPCGLSASEGLLIIESPGKFAEALEDFISRQISQ